MEGKFSPKIHLQFRRNVWHVCKLPGVHEPAQDIPDPCLASKLARAAMRAMLARHRPSTYAMVGLLQAKPSLPPFPTCYCTSTYLT